MRSSGLKVFLSNFSGVILGAVYGLGLRLLFEPVKDWDLGFADLFSFSFIWIAPMVIATIPLLFANEEKLRSSTYRAFSPIATVAVFFGVLLLTRIEDLVCLVIIGIPFLIGAGVAGSIIGWLILRYRQKKNNKLYSVILIPLIAGMLEAKLPEDTKTFEVRTVTIIYASPDKVWQNVVRVRKIADDEYQPGFFNYAGIPRPLYAELDKDTIGGTRVGHFEGGLKFVETVDTWERNKKVSFNI